MDNDIEILTNIFELSEYKTCQINSLESYKKATRNINRIIKGIKSRLGAYKSKMINNGKISWELELYQGKSCYVNQDEVRSFFIETIKGDLSKMSDDDVLKLIEHNYKLLIKTLKQWNQEKSTIKNEIKCLDLLIKDGNSDNFEAKSNEEIKINSYNLKLLNKKNRTKFFADFSQWKTNKLLDINIPNEINNHLDKIFQDEELRFKEFETFDFNKLKIKRDELFVNIESNILDYMIGNSGHISIEKVRELIELQLLVLLKSYNKYSQSNDQFDDTTNSRTEYGELNAIRKKFLIEHMDKKKKKRGQTITSKQRKQIEKILEEDYPGVKIVSLLSELRYDGFAKPQDRIR